MNVQFTARHFKPSGTIRTHALHCVEKFETYADNINHAEVILTELPKTTRTVCTAEFIVKVYDTVLITKASEATHIEAINAAAKKLEKVLDKHNEKRKSERLRKSKQTSSRS